MSTVNKLALGVFSAYHMHFFPLIFSFFYFYFLFCSHDILCCSSLVQRRQDCKSLSPASPSRRPLWDKTAQDPEEKCVFSCPWQFNANGKFPPAFQIGVFPLAPQRSVKTCLIHVPLLRNGPGWVFLVMQISLPAAGHQMNWK